MIDAEEIYDSAQETGFRLCPTRKDEGLSPDRKLFSAAWDPNVVDRLFMCSQDGKLQTYNIRTQKFKSYHVLFKMFSSSASKVDSSALYNKKNSSVMDRIDYKANKFNKKQAESSSNPEVMTRHFDKMVLIPNRKDEFIFVMGVSQTLMYSALPSDTPYADNPLIASTSRSDFNDFVFGTPVMEIDKHATRVTSLSVSTSGQVLASGDENGSIRLLLLRQLDMFNIRPSVKYKTDTNGATVVDTVREHSIPTLPLGGRKAFTAHGGPVFALQWLPFAMGPNSRRSYLLCSGSADHVVRFWHVRATVDGLTLSPLLHLDIQSSVILCMTSYFLDSSTMTPFEAAKTGGSVLLSAGTDSGTVYVWNMPVNALFDLVNEDELKNRDYAPDDSEPHTAIEKEDILNVSVMHNKDESHDNSRKKSELLAGFEYAKWIHSLLHTSVNPIYTLQLTTHTNEANDCRYVILLSADISGMVHLHKSDDSDFIVIKPKNEIETQGISTPGGSDSLPHSAKALAVMSPQASASYSPFGIVEECPLSFCGESQYRSQVVSIIAQYSDRGVAGLDTVFRDFSLFTRALFSSQTMKVVDEEMEAVGPTSGAHIEIHHINKKDGRNHLHQHSQGTKLVKKVRKHRLEDTPMPPSLFICLADCSMNQFYSKDLFLDFGSIHEVRPKNLLDGPVGSEPGHIVKPFSPEKPLCVKVSSSPGPKSKLCGLDSDTASGPNASRCNQLTAAQDLDELPPPPPPLPVPELQDVPLTSPPPIAKAIQMDAQFSSVSLPEPPREKLKIVPVPVTSALSKAQNSTSEPPTSIVSPTNTTNAVSPVKSVIFRPNMESPMNDHDAADSHDNAQKEESEFDALQAKVDAAITNVLQSPLSVQNIQSVKVSSSVLVLQ